jgi:hypothetical protein
MTIDSVSAESTFLGKQGGALPVYPGFFNFLTLGMLADAALGLMAPQLGAPISFRYLR